MAHWATETTTADLEPPQPMKRKLVRQGGSALTVTLPSTWVKANSLKPGQEIDIQEEDHQLILSKDTRDGGPKRATLNTDGLNKIILNKYLEVFYIAGIQEIIITYSKPDITDFKTDTTIPVEEYANRIKDRFIGMEIVSQAKGRIALQTLGNTDDLNKKDTIKNRVFFLTKEMLQEFLHALDGDFKQFNRTVYTMHDNILKFTIYLERLVHASSIPQDQKMRTLTLYETLNKAIDKIRHTGERLAETRTITPKMRKYLHLLFSYFIEHFEISIKSGYTLKELDAIIRRRYALVNTIKSETFTAEEWKVIAEAKALLETLPESMSYHGAMNLDKHLAPSGATAAD